MFEFINKYKERKLEKLTSESTCALGNVLLIANDINYGYKDVKSVLYKDEQELFNDIKKVCPNINHDDLVIVLYGLKEAYDFIEVPKMKYKYMIQFDDGISDTVRNIGVEY